MSEESAQRAPAGSQVTLTVIVVSYNTRHLLTEMFGALERASDGLSTQIIVIDNASQDGSADFIRIHWPGAQLLANTCNVGFGRANNQALPLLRGRNVLLLNTDAIVAPASIGAALDELRAHPACGLVGARLVGRDGKVQPSCRYFPTPWNIFLLRTGLARLFPHTQQVDDLQWNDRLATECDWVPGAFLLCRREVIDEVGLFDPRYFLYYEEVDFCRAAKHGGWSVRYCPSADVVHIGGESAKSEGQLSASGRQLLALQVESELLYFRKQYGLPGVLCGIALTALGDLIEVLKRVARPWHRSRSTTFFTGLSVRMFSRTRLATRPTR